MTYYLKVLANLLFTLVAYVLAPVVALFCKGDGYLPDWLCWFQTQDAPLDAGVRDGYPGFLATDSKWWNRTKWLWRNPAYGFCYWPLGIPYVHEDWVIDVCTRDSSGTLTEFKAHTKDNRYFCNTNSSGLKLGYKVWWALNGDTLLPAMEASRGPDNRIPFCFTPK